MWVQLTNKKSCFRKSVMHFDAPFIPRGVACWVQGNSRSTSFVAVKAIWIGCLR
ncbi:Uncharacterized protein APZ42_020902 [Daphnia magna]|uniref:Uncharacterized protein n=1 Tax=Daphnia magna TaxID=35525 RepID=A0A162CBS4_9CRUS|nr:Uncharacterized protein APZ42_020902 [Daphnia magna]